MSSGFTRDESVSSILDFVHGLAARLGNIGVNSAPVFWLFDTDDDCRGFQAQVSQSGQFGANVGNVELLAGGFVGALRNAGLRLSIAGGVVRKFAREADQVYCRLLSDKPFGSLLTAIRQRSQR